MNRIALPALIALAVVRALPAAELPDYQVGDMVQEDILSPSAFAVLNADETQAQRQTASSKVAVICRYYTNAIDQAETEFKATFATAQSNFLDNVLATFKQRQLAPDALATESFRQLIADFQIQHPSFPVSPVLAEIWARGESDAAVRERLLTVLREAMRHRIRPPNIAAEVKFVNSVLLVPLKSWADPLTLEKADTQGVNVSRTNIITWTRLREKVLESTLAEDKWATNVLMSFITTNCVPDVEVTLQARARRASPVWAADHYEPGQVIARKGQVVDRKIKAAIDQIRENSAAGKAAEKMQEDLLKAQQARQRARWVAAAFCSLLFGAVGVLWYLARRAQPQSLVPMRLGDGSSATVVSCPSCAQTFVVPERVPAVSGELRARVAPHLARMLMDKFVRHLLFQRTSLLDTQAKAAAEMAELESRLERVNAPLQERLRTYEQRILELEKELVQKGKENRELIRLKIQLVRNQLASTKERVELN